MQAEPDATELLDNEPSPAETAAPRRPGRWCLGAAEAGVEFATAILKFPIDGRPDRPVSLPGYPVDEVYHRGFQSAGDLVEVWRGGDEGDDDEQDYGASEADWLAIDWSHRLCKHLIHRLGWAPWLDFEPHALAFYLGDEAAHDHLRRLAAGPYQLTAHEARALAIVRKRLRRLLLVAAELPEPEAEPEEAPPLDPEVEAFRDSYEREHPRPEPPSLVVLIPPEPLPGRRDGKLVVHRYRGAGVMHKAMPADEVPDNAVVVPASTPTRQITFRAWKEAGCRTK